MPRPHRSTQTVTIEPKGPFSLEEAATFGFGQREAAPYDGVMRLAFCLDGYRRHAGAEVRQDERGVHLTITGDDDVDLDVDAVRRQVARVLSLDHDGDEFTAIGERDPVIRRLQAVAPGLRPPLFYSPYEAAAWSVLSARRSAGQAEGVRRRLSEAHGATRTLAGEQLTALPIPAQLLDVREFPGIDETRLRRLHGVAAAAFDGRLDADRLCAMGSDAAMSELRNLDGIGPFYSSLIAVRGTGFADVLPTNEPKLLALVARLYGLPGPPSPEQLTSIAENWRPLRTWAAVLIRAVADRQAVAGEEMPTPPKVSAP